MRDDRGGGFGPGGFGPMHDPYWAHHGDGHSLEWLPLFFLIALLVFLAVWLVLRLTRGRSGQALAVATASGPRPDDALTAVRMRYARGEIDRDAFLRISADLGGGPEPSGEAPTLA